MRTTKGVTKVVDFGLVRSEFAETRYTQQGTLLGTPAFMRLNCGRARKPVRKAIFMPWFSRTIIY